MPEAVLYKQFHSELKDVDTKGRQMIGAFTRYNVLDSDGDLGKKGMFSKTWKENFSRIKHLLNHDVNKPVGKISELWDDDNYAYYKSTVGTHALGDDVLKMAESGLLTEHSYGYQVTKNNSTKAGNELLEVKQWELSNLTGWGANEYSPLLSFTKDSGNNNLVEKIQKRQKSLESFCRNATATDETIQLLLNEYKDLAQVLQDLETKTTKPLETSTLPDSAWVGTIRL